MSVISIKSSMKRWLLLASCTLFATADASKTCGSVAEALLPRGPLIIAPQPNELLISYSDDLLDEHGCKKTSRSDNLRSVTLQLDYSTPLHGHVTSEIHASCLRLLVVVGLRFCIADFRSQQKKHSNHISIKLIRY